MLQSFAGAVLTKTAPGRLIQDYLRRAMAKPGIDELAPKLLAEMITDKGTKRPIAEAELARAAGADPALARKTLYLLGEEGVVRELAREQKIWEISHDFVARQLGQIPRLKPSRWRQAQRAATPIALIAWLLILVGGYPIYQIWRVYNAANTLQSAGVAVSGGKGAYRLTFDSHERRGDRRTQPGAITRTIEHVEFLNPIELTVNNNDQLAALPSLAACTKLERPWITGNGNFDPPILDDFMQLKQVALIGDHNWFEVSEALKDVPATTLVGVPGTFLERGFADQLNRMRANAGLEEVVVVDWQALQR